MGHIRHNAHQNDKKRYSGGRVILNAIRSGVNFIVNKLVDYIIGGISSVFILSWSSPKSVFVTYLRNNIQGSYLFFIPPQTKSDPYVHPFVRSSVRPSQSLIRYSSKTAEQNFMKLSGIVHYMMPYCPSYFNIFFEWFWGFPEQNKDFAIQNMGERGYHFVSIAYSISSFFRIWDELTN